MLAFDQVSELVPKQFGKIKNIIPITIGLSGSQVYTLVMEGGQSFVLKMHDASCNWSSLLQAQTFASDAGIAAKIMFTDEEKRLILFEKIEGSSLGEAASRANDVGRVIQGVLSQLSCMQKVDASALPVAQTAQYARDIWTNHAKKMDLPEWARSCESLLWKAAEALDGDFRRVFSHGDLNPGNILWDGNKIWIVDWERAGRDHPFLDLATICNFLSIPTEVGEQLLSGMLGQTLMEDDRRIFNQLRKLSSIVYGVTFLKMTPGLDIPASTFDETQSLSECFQLMKSGKLDLSSPDGQVRIGMAFLKQAHI